MNQELKNQKLLRFVENHTKQQRGHHINFVDLYNQITGKDNFIYENIKSTNKKDLPAIKVKPTTGYCDFVHFDVDINKEYRGTLNLKQQQQLYLELSNKIINLFGFGDGSSNIFLCFASPNWGLKFFVTAVGVNSQTKYNLVYDAVKHKIEKSIDGVGEKFEVDATTHIRNGTGLCYIPYREDKYVYFDEDALSYEMFPSGASYDVFKEYVEREGVDVVLSKDNSKLTYDEVEDLSTLNVDSRTKNIKEILDWYLDKLLKDGTINEKEYNFEKGNRNEVSYRLYIIGKGFGILPEKIKEYGVKRWGNYFAERPENKLYYLKYHNDKKYGYGYLTPPKNLRTDEDKIKQDSKKIFYEVDNYVTEKLDDINNLLETERIIKVSAQTRMGKSYAFTKLDNLEEEECLVFCVPAKTLVDEFSLKYNLTPLKCDFENNTHWLNDIKIEAGKGYVCTFDQIKNIIENEDKIQGRIKLVIDEAHELIYSMNYRYTAIKSVLDILDKEYLSKCIMMSGTIEVLDSLKYPKIIINKKNKRIDEVHWVKCTSPIESLKDYTLKRLETGCETMVVMLNTIADCLTYKEFLDDNKIKSIGVFNRGGVESFEVSDFNNNPDVKVLYGTIKIEAGITITRKVEDYDIVCVDKRTPKSVKQFLARAVNDFNEPKCLMLVNENVHDGKKDICLHPSIFYSLYEKKLNVIKSDAEKNNISVSEQIEIYQKLETNSNKLKLPDNVEIINQKGDIHEHILIHLSAAFVDILSNRNLSLLYKILEETYNVKVVKIDENHEIYEKINTTMEKHRKLNKQNVEHALMSLWGGDKLFLETLDVINKRHLHRAVNALKQLENTTHDSLPFFEFKDNISKHMLNNDNKKIKEYCLKVEKNVKALILLHIMENEKGDFGDVIRETINQETLDITPLKKYYEKQGEYFRIAENKKEKEIIEKKHEVVKTTTQIKKVLKTVLKTKSKRLYEGEKRIKVDCILSIKTEKEIYQDLNFKKSCLVVDFNEDIKNNLF